MKKLSSLILSFMLMFGIQLTSLNTVCAAVDLTKEGTYTVDVDLWNETKDQASMAAGALEKQARIVVKDGKTTMYLTGKEMRMGTITAWLQELYIGSMQSNYHDHSATVESRDEQGNPTMWSFELPHQEEYISVVMNPHVAMMGNMDLGARIKVNYNTLKYVESVNPEEPEQPHQPTTEPKNEQTNKTEENPVTPTTVGQQSSTVNQKSKAVQTGDQQSIGLFISLMLVSLVFAGYTIKKELCK